MADGRNRDLVYDKCEARTLWNYHRDCGINQEQYTEVYVSPEDPDHKPKIDSWQVGGTELDEQTARDIREGSFGYAPSGY